MAGTLATTVQEEFHHVISVMTARRQMPIFRDFLMLLMEQLVLPVMPRMAQGNMAAPLGRNIMIVVIAIV
jgi:hypothetical protein